MSARGLSTRVYLIAEQMGYGALVAFNIVPAAISKGVHRGELLEDRGRVDDCDEVMETCHVIEGHAGRLATESERQRRPGKVREGQGR